MNKKTIFLFVPIWKDAPFLRIIIPIIVGIIVQWYAHLPFVWLTALSILTLIALLICFYSNAKKGIWMGACINKVLLLIGCWLVFFKSESNWHNNIQQHYTVGSYIVATLQEPPSEKAKSYKADASLQIIDSHGIAKNVSGKAILYLSKTPQSAALQYGSRIVFKKLLQPIANTQNPGCFDFKRYAAFNGIFYQVFLKPTEYVVDDKRVYNPFRASLFTIRDRVVKIFQTNIPGKVEPGLAEALLIGYKDDLDKELVEQYANTGVVHIIAISGMHLALIYSLLLSLLAPLKKYGSGRFMSSLIIIAVLWAFSLLTGAAPSITRAALMLTIVVLGSNFQKKTSIFNSLAISALLLLLYNPFYLWDVGFQLSYAALLSIAVFSNPITHLLYFSNKLLNNIWQLIAITLAAQVLTFPLILYHFHQFPLYFLLANIIAVPISGIILYGLVLLLIFFWQPWFAKILGTILHFIIASLNACIGFIDKLPNSKITNIFSTIPMTILVALIISFMAWWLLKKSVSGLILSFACFLFWLALFQWNHYQSLTQKKLLVYNVPQKTAIEIIDGRNCYFIGDTALHKKAFLQNFYLLPSRIALQTQLQKNYTISDNGFTSLTFQHKKILIIAQSVNIKTSQAIQTDLLIIGRNVRTPPEKLLKIVKCRTVLLDGSTSNWQAKQWKNAADSLHLRFHNVQTQGAFIQNL